MPTMYLTPHAHIVQIVEVNPTLALFLADEETLPPTLCPELVPDGWTVDGEVLDFNIGNEWVEAWLLTKEDPFD